MVVCLAFSAGISCPLSQKCGTNNLVRYIDINKLRHGLGDGVCYYLIGMHAVAYTRCDTVRAFASRGKVEALKLRRSEHCQDMFREMEQSWESFADLFKKLQSFTCKLHTSSTRTVNINTIRHLLFCARRGELESTQLPPCEDCLFVHTMHPVKRGWVRNGCRDLQLPRQCCSCCRSGATVDASSRNVGAWATV